MGRNGKTLNDIESKCEKRIGCVGCTSTSVVCSDVMLSQLDLLKQPGAYCFTGVSLQLIWDLSFRGFLLFSLEVFDKLARQSENIYNF